MTSQWPDFYTSSSLSSESPKKEVSAAQVGAGVTDETFDQFYHHEKFIKWINDTKKKLPRGTPKLRKETFLADPLIKGTLYPYLKNTILKGSKIQTADNKLYSAAVTDITNYVNTIKLLKVFRDDFLYLHFLNGHSYRRADPDINWNIIHLEGIEPSSVTMYTDPWDSSIIAYHQHASVNSSWSSYGMSEIFDSWFVPFGGKVKNIYDTYTEGVLFGNSNAALFIFNDFKDKYKITDVQKLRIGAAERIIAMHQAVNFKVPDTDYDDYRGPRNGDFAPIDPVIVPVFLKRLLISSSPNLVFAVLNPFLHAIMGIMKDVKDANGNPKIISSNPERPIASDPMYEAKAQRYNDFMDAFRKLSDNVVKNFKEGGVLTTGPDIKLEPIESARNVTHQFIRGLIDQLDDEICYNFGIPKALISSKGSELATSRTVAETYNTVHAGERTDYEEVADSLISNQFAGKTWTGTKLEKDEQTGEKKEVQFTYTFEEIQAHFELEVPNLKDLLQEAQAFKTNVDGLVQVKNIGAGKEDMQALCDEIAGLGILSLDNFSAPMNSPEGGTAGGGAQITAMQSRLIVDLLKAGVYEAMMAEGLISVVEPTEPSGFKDEKIKKLLLETYEEGRKGIDLIFEEH